MAKDKNLNKADFDKNIKAYVQSTDEECDNETKLKKEKSLKGFVTIATGDLRYYEMARNLLRSYRQTTKAPISFAIIADRQNEYTEEFDDVIILENPTNTWVDKFSLLTHCPYKENIFIDADCLIYQDFNFLWDIFRCADDFSVFGKAIDLNDCNNTGWFSKEASEFYDIKFITHLHGMIYFIRPGQNVEKMHHLCKKIVDDYGKVKFAGFNDRIADEPVFALAMAILDMKPVAREANYYCFVPYATKIKTDFYRKKVVFKNPKDGLVKNGKSVHWGNMNTKGYQYRFDAHVINCYHNYPKKRKIQKFLLYKCKILRLAYYVQEGLKKMSTKIAWFFTRLWNKLFKKK